MQDLIDPLCFYFSFMHQLDKHLLILDSFWLEVHSLPPFKVAGNWARANIDDPIKYPQTIGDILGSSQSDQRWDLRVVDFNGAVEFDNNEKWLQVLSFRGCLVEQLVENLCCFSRCLWPKLIADIKQKLKDISMVNIFLPYFSAEMQKIEELLLKHFTLDVENVDNCPHDLTPQFQLFIAAIAVG